MAHLNRLLIKSELMMEQCFGLEIVLHVGLLATDRLDQMIIDLMHVGLHVRILSIILVEYVGVVLLKLMMLHLRAKMMRMMLLTKQLMHSCRTTRHIMHIAGSIGRQAVITCRHMMSVMIVVLISIGRCWRRAVAALVSILHVVIVSLIVVLLIVIIVIVVVVIGVVVVLGVAPIQTATTTNPALIEGTETVRSHHHATASTRPVIATRKSNTFLLSPAWFAPEIELVQTVASAAFPRQLAILANHFFALSATFLLEAVIVAC